MSHPLHPAFVHFPIATWTLATVADLASLHWGQPAWQFAGVTMAIGTLAALAAMATGFVELQKLEHGSPVIRAVNRHMLLMMAAWCCYATSLFLRLEGTSLTRPGMLSLGMSVIGFLVLCIAGWWGGRLVYEHGIGVRGRRRS